MFTWFLHFENLFMICAFSTCKILKGKENEYRIITSSSLNLSSTHCPLKIQYNPHQCILVRSPPSSLSKRRIIFSHAFQTKHSHLLFLPNAKMFPSLRYLHVIPSFWHSLLYDCNLFASYSNLTLWKMSLLTKHIHGSPIKL